MKLKFWWKNMPLSKAMSPNFLLREVSWKFYLKQMTCLSQSIVLHFYHFMTPLNEDYVWWFYITVEDCNASKHFECGQNLNYT